MRWKGEEGRSPPPPDSSLRGLLKKERGITPIPRLRGGRLFAGMTRRGAPRGEVGNWVGDGGLVGWYILGESATFDGRRNGRG